MLAIDTETTGLDHWHGARPYLVTTCDEAGVQRFWEWPVDPETRVPQVPAEDVQEIWMLLAARVERVFHNAKFDVHALGTVGVGPWHWDGTHDTVLLAHLLESNRPKNLTDLAFRWLGTNIEPHEQALKAACLEARRVARTNWPEWALASAGRADMPSAKETTWKYDGWLPRAVADAAGWPSDHPWRTVLSTYANADSAATLALWLVLKAEAERRGLWAIYQERLKAMPVAAAMEARGVTLSRRRLADLREHCRGEAAEAEGRCRGIAAACTREVRRADLFAGVTVEQEPVRLELPKGGRNKSLDEFCFDVLKLPVLGWTEAGRPTFDKATIDRWLDVLPEGPGLEFVRALRYKRRRDTAVTYLDGYERFGLPLSAGELTEDWLVLHPSLNQTGTDTLRWSSANPNAQNISKQETEHEPCRGEGCPGCRGTGKEFRSLRWVFGPAPGREWWSLDAKNIELRIPAYLSGEADLIALFERPDEPPYYGSVHLLNFHTVYPEIWAAELAAVGFEKVGPHCKKKYAATNYQWDKNGGFSKQYGAGRAKVDATFRRPGADALLDARFGKLAKLNADAVRLAERHGYVETVPDATVDPRRGYPLLCTRSERGGVVPTTPLNYKIQGTAMQWTAKAMVRCHTRLEDWNRDGFDGHVVMQVHDEIVFDLSKRGNPAKDIDPKRSNLTRVRELQRIMERGGEDIGIPTPVGVEWHADNWSEGVTF